MKNTLSPQLEREIESATRKIFGYGIKSVKKGSTSQADSQKRLEQKQRIIDAIKRAIVPGEDKLLVYVEKGSPVCVWIEESGIHWLSGYEAKEKYQALKRERKEEYDKS